MYYKLITSIISALLMSLSFIAQECGGGVNISRCIGTLDDGSGLSHYADNLDCEYTVYNPLGCAIEVNFEYLQTEPCCDLITIYDGPDDSWPQIGVFSGFSSLPSFVTSGASFHIRFTTNEQNNFNGWTVSWNGTRRFNSCEGIITDGSGPNTYVNDQYSAWLIVQPNTESITFVMDEVDMEFKYDYVHVYDGSTTNAPILASYNGTFTGDPLMTMSDTVLIIMITDGSGVAGGFSGHYYATDAVYEECSGTIDQVYDGFGHLYESEVICDWLIQTPYLLLYFRFNEFSLENGFDRLIVYDGPDENSPIVDEFTGFELPDDFTSSSGSVYMKFESDWSFESTGFEIEYSCQPFLNIKEVSADGIEVFPVPAEEWININNNSELTITNIFITDVTGKPVESYTNDVIAPGQSLKIQPHISSAGLYMLNYQQNNMSFTKSILLQ